MSYLYQYRVRKARGSFAEFAETIKEGKPEMQMKEMIKHVVNQLFKYNYFHGFVTQELRHTDYLKEELMDFYNTFTFKLDDVVKKGIATGVFTNAPNPEDLITIIIGSALFVVRNQNFYQMYVPGSNDRYLDEAEKKIRGNLLVTIFSVLGYNPEAWKVKVS